MTGEDLLHFFRGELVPLDMEDVVIIPLKAGNEHTTIVARCIYTTLQPNVFRPARQLTHSSGTFFIVPICSTTYLIITAGEDPAEFDALAERYRQTSRRVGANAEALVANLVRTEWLLARLHALEVEIWERQIR